MKRPSMKEKCTMRYDVRTVTLRGSQLTFSTCDKRIKTIISIPEFFTERYPASGGWELKGANIGMDRKGKGWTGKEGYSSISSTNALITI